MVTRLHLVNSEQRNLKVDAHVHALLKAFAYKHNMSISTAANLLVQRAIAYEYGMKLPPLHEQLANLIKKRID